MRLGAQVSTAGGLFHAFERGEAVGCDTIMVFTKSNRQWRARPITGDDQEKFEQAAEEFSHITPVAAHASYLINLASANEELWERSKEALKIEYLRAAQLGISTVTFHPGSAVDGNIEASLFRIAKGLKQIFEETESFGGETTLCLETMAGQGSQLGHRFEHLAEIIEAVDIVPERLGVCLDTCHIFAAGYDIRTTEGYTETMDSFDAIVGLERIKCFHLNDSVHPLESRKDRHAHIGEGEIGLEGFTALLNDPRWAEHPGHIETPKVKKKESKDGKKGKKVKVTKVAKKAKKAKELDMDPVNLQVLRGLVKEKSLV